MKNFIFVVEGVMDHETSDAIKAFELEGDAVVFIDAINTHEGKRPKCPDTNDADSIWEKFALSQESWVKRHPAREFYGRDCYVISKVELVKSKPFKGTL